MLVSLTDASQMLGGISRSTLWRLIHERRAFGPVKIGRRVMIRRAEIEQFVKRSSVRLRQHREYRDPVRGS